MTPARYREPGRGFGSTALFGALLAAGFALDVALGGASAHLVAWIAAAVLVLGVDLLTIYAARSTKTLIIDDDEVRIGDEAVARSSVVGATAGLDPDLPTLGWLTGAPRDRAGVVIQLTDGRSVVVPTRRPERVLAALGVGAGSTDDRFEVRAADDDELAGLDEIDERAEVVFRVSGYALPSYVAEVPDEPAAVFVAGRPPVGFARVDVVDGLAHLTEVAVVPGMMRRGVGGRLLERVCRWARDEGFAAITLTTFADVPWNGPIYARRGWVDVVDGLGPELAAIRDRERAGGLDEVGRRVAMRLDLTAPE